MKVMILGAGGMLAKDLIRVAPPDAQLFPYTRMEADITDHRAVARALDDCRPDVVVNCAAYTAVDDAESQKDTAFAVNGTAVGALGELAKKNSAPPLVVHFSSDYVFDGRAGRPYREDAETTPLGIYGQSKLLGEQKLRESGAEHVIIRTQWLFGSGGRSFPRTMWERARKGQATRVVDDQTGRPTYTVDLAGAVWTLLALKKPVAGSLPTLLHVANGGKATWYQVAARVFAAADQTALLTPCTTAEFPRPAARPVWSVLDTETYDSLTGRPLPDWESAVDRMVGELVAEGTT
jgi:dTDP-4-dehydrorhamnose reductase